MGQFDSTLEKLRWADSHAAALDACLAEFRGEHPTLVAYQSNAEGTEHVFILRQFAAPTPDITLRLGDWLFNLRATLDHLIYEASVPARRPDRPAFPFTRSRDAFKKAVKRELAGVQSQVAFIESLQLYNAPHPDPIVERHAEFLRMLNDLNNWDKHNTVHLVRQAAQFSVAHNQTVDPQGWVGPLEVDTELLRFRTAAPDDVEVDTASKVGFLIDVAIDHSQQLRGIVDVVDGCRSAVGFVLDRFGIQAPLALYMDWPLNEGIAIRRDPWGTGP